MELLPGTFEGEKCVILCVFVCLCVCVCVSYAVRAAQDSSPSPDAPPGEGALVRPGSGGAVLAVRILRVAAGVQQAKVAKHVAVGVVARAPGEELAGGVGVAQAQAHLSIGDLQERSGEEAFEN